MSILHALIVGEGSKDLIVLHGFLGMGDNWKTHAKNWATQDWRVHLLDQRNHGRSFWSSNFSYDLMAKDLLNYMEEKQLKSATVLGHSMGGKVAMNFACSHPQKVDQLIIADIAPKVYPPHHQMILNGLKSLDFSQIRSRKDADMHLAAYVEDVATRQFLLKNIYRVSPTELGLRFNIEVLQHAGHQIGETLHKGAKYLGDVLFLKGAKSEYIEAEDALLIRHHFPKSTLMTIASAGHWLHAENPTAFTEAIESWRNI